MSVNCWLLTTSVVHANSSISFRITRTLLSWTTVPRFPKHNSISVGCFNTLHRAGGRTVDVGGQAFIRGGQSLKLSTAATVFKRVSLLIEGPKHVDWGWQAPLGAGLVLTTNISKLFICIMLFRNTDSPNGQFKQPFHHKFISDFHMNYDVGLTSNNSSLAVNKKGLWSQKTLLLKRPAWILV